MYIHKPLFLDGVHSSITSFSKWSPRWRINQNTAITQLLDVLEFNFFSNYLLKLHVISPYNIKYNKIRISKMADKSKYSHNSAARHASVEIFFSNYLFKLHVISLHNI